MSDATTRTDPNRFMTDQKPILVWFRQDLRTSDHPALAKAAEMGAPVVPVFVLDDETPEPWAPGGASRWWLHHSLMALGHDLGALGAPLNLRRGNAVDAVASLAEDIDAGAVHFSRRYEPWAIAEEKALKERLDGLNVDCRRFGGALLFEPEAMPKPYKVFTPFWKACLGLDEPKAPISAPEKIARYGDVASDHLADWKLLPTVPDWAGGLREEWTPGEEGAHQRLEQFLSDGLENYKDGRDIPGKRWISRLSPHLHFGEISPRQIWHRTHAFAGRSTRKGIVRQADAFLREIGWREFSHHLLVMAPKLPSRSFRPEFEAFPWRDDPEALEAWQKGQTGYPIVDAGMRELWHSGWMHNRVRMVVASFLIKHLLIDWREGEDWFWDTLVDADLANNAASWQWVAGSGADAAPYFRIFNPVLQGEKFDGDGAYVRQWVPEIADLPDKYLHKPWDAPDEVLAEAGVVLGETYPAPIVDHKAARERALAVFKSLKDDS